MPAAKSHAQNSYLQEFPLAAGLRQRELMQPIPAAGVFIGCNTPRLAGAAENNNETKKNL